MDKSRSLGDFTFGGSVTGLWAFAHEGRFHIGVFDRDLSERRGTMTLARLEAGDKFLTLRQIDNDSTSLRAVDARVIGSEMRFVLELNLGHALDIVAAPLAPLLDPGVPSVMFQPLRQIGPWPQLAERVKLDAADQWNVASGGPPEQWLFNPRFAPGAATASLIVNTADGQAMLLNDEGMPGGLVSDAALPQWWERNAQRVVAFQRMAKPYRPFRALSRYSAPKLIPPSELWVVDASTAPRSLSAEYKLGSVIGFALAEGPRGEPWLLALTRAKAGVAISALARSAKGWAMVHEWPVDAQATRIVALWQDDAWHIVLAHGEPATSLQYLRR